MLLVASYIFYGSWDWRYLSLLLVSTIVDYLCGLWLQKTPKTEIDRRKFFVFISVFVNVGILCTFKYYDFFAGEFQSIMGNFGLTVHPYFLDVILPIGISFYTFQTMSYTIDVYRGKLKATDDFLDFALYVSFFPQLIAGPIERGMRLLPQIIAPRTVTLYQVYKGLYFALWGLFLKVVIADNLAKIADPVFAAPGPYEGASVLLATYAFSYQIYCDFAGYSFMAIGFALMMGINLMENFRRPYFSKNIGDFWRRWHISLSSWFRDYVFSPLYIRVERITFLKRFNTKIKHAIAFFIALLSAEYLLGLWHGAGWNFGVFGIFHGFAIWAYYIVRLKWDRMPAILQILLTYNIACIGWLIFRSTSLGQAGEMFVSIFTNFSPSLNEALIFSIIQFVGLISILVTVQVFQDMKNNTLVVLEWPRPIRIGFIIGIGWLTILFGAFEGRPFIYFQF